MSTAKERHGRVVDSGGAPVSGARVVIVASTVPMPEIALITDARGRFSLSLPPGQFTMRAHGSDDAAGESDVEGDASDEIVIVTRK